MLRKSIRLAAIFFFLATVTAAQESNPILPGKQDKCPVCGMFVHKYPDWVGRIDFDNHKKFFFDGAKDLFKYYFKLDKYNPGKTIADISGIWVTEYYDMAPIPAQTAYFVIGSDVYGPMGRELIPFRTAEAAEEFKNDHGGTGVLVFDKITPAIIETLD